MYSYRTAGSHFPFQLLRMSDLWAYAAISSSSAVRAAICVEVGSGEICGRVVGEKAGEVKYMAAGKANEDLFFCSQK